MCMYGKKLQIVYWLAAAPLLLLYGCYNYKYDKTFPLSSTCDTTNVSYSRDIVPVITANCAVAGGCHDAAGSSVSGHDYTTYAGVKAVATYDFIVTDINWVPTAGHNNMPKNGAKLPDCDINKITRWVNEGAPNN
jgi:hypothetical protein